MKKRIDTNFLLGLYLFIRQLQLSIDRSLNDDWTKLVRYLDSKTSIQMVLDRLQSMSTINLEDKIAIEGVYKPTLSKGFWGTFIARKSCLTDEELIYIYAQLKILVSLLKNNSPDHKELIELRMNLFHSEALVANRISKRNLVNKEFVEHFNQNEFLSFESIDKLVGKPWL